MNNLTLKQLRYFEALARTKHFGKAAEACAISQPALSMQIRELEASFGARLFERTAREVQLTALGFDLHGRIGDILRSVDELGEFARARQQEFSGKIRIGIIPTIAPYLLPSLIGHLSSAFPKLEPHVRETQTQNLVAELHAGKLDTAILALPISEPGLEETALFGEPFILVRPVHDADKEVPNADALSRMRLLLLEEGHCFRDQALSFCNTSLGLPKESLEGSSLSTLVQMVGAGMGVTLIPEMAVGVETRSADVSIARFAPPVPSRTIGMVWRKTSPLANQLNLIAEIVKKAKPALSHKLP